MEAMGTVDNRSSAEEKIALFRSLFRGRSDVYAHARAKFVVGLSATVTRKDGHHPIILMQCGPIRHRVSAKEQASQRSLEHFVFVRPTGFQPVRAANPNVRVQFHDL